MKLVKEHPELYDKSSPIYCRRENADIVWEEIAEKIGCGSGKCKSMHGSTHRYNVNDKRNKAFFIIFNYFITIIQKYTHYHVCQKDQTRT